MAACYTWLVAVFALAALAATTDAGACRNLGCSKTGSPLFQYAAGQTYTYNLEGHSLAKLPEQQDEGVKIELRAVAEVHFGADCANSVQLRDVSITGPAAKKFGGLKELEAHAAKFSFSETEICADADDTNAALNLKRAVISLLQVSTPQASGSASKHETDVFGVCPTDFSIVTSGGETTVTKSRNLNKCAHREELQQRILSTPYVSKADLQSSPLLESTLTVEQHIKAGVIQTAESKETYLFRPFANKDAGARTVISTKLTLVSHAAKPEHTVSKPVAKSVIFDAPHGSEAVAGNVAAVVKAMHDARASMPDQAGQNAATEFRHLVDTVRETTKNDLLAVYGQVKAGAGFSDKKSARKLFLDALFRAGSGESVQAAVELIKSGEISAEIAPLWYTSFGFVRHASLSALTSAATLLEGKPSRAAFLGVGALAGRYCRQHECAGAKAFDDLLAKLAAPIAKGCHCTNHEEEDVLIASLKGLENAKHLNEATAQLLRVCVSDAKVPARVRVAALEAFRADACQPQLKKTALEILKDVQEDSEIRIKAYLAAVECVCGSLANALKEIIDHEPVNQVGSFIVSHLRNIRASKNPEHDHARHHFSEIRSSKRFPEDIRRYSHNREFSYFLDAANLGGSIERNVIYSQQSYLPRSTNLNLTAEIFGHSFNLLEIGTRAENLDRVVEAYFGPRGYLRSNELKDVASAGKTRVHNVAEKLEARYKQSFRSKRSVPVSQLEAFRKKISLANDHHDIDLDLSVKLFGNTVLVRSYHGDAHTLSPENIIDKIFDRLDNCLDNAKNFNYEIKQHGIFLDTEVTYPTGLGFPLKLAATGSSAVHLKLEGKIDLKAILKDPKNAHVQFEVIPSGAIEVTGSLFVDAFAVEAGQTLAATLHTSTGVNIDAHAVEGGGIDVSVGLPLKKQDIVSFKSDVFVSVRERGQAPVETAVAIVAKRKDYHGCFDQLSPFVGLTFCGEVAVPVEGLNSKAALFPLNGPARFQLTVESDDVSAYKFRVAKTADANGRKLQLLVDTPNSKTNRKVELILESKSQPNRELRASLTSPYKTASAELVLVNTDKEVSLNGKLTNDGQEYSARLGAEVSGSEGHRTYKPLLEYGGPGKSGKKAKKGKAEYSVDGTVTVDKTGDGRKVTFNNIAVSAPAGKVSLAGWVLYEPNAISSDLKVTHGGDKTVVVKSKLQKLAPLHFNVEAEVSASTHPDLGVSLKWDYHRTKEQLDSNLVVVHGQDLKSEEAKLTASVAAKYSWVNSKDFTFSGKGKVKYPLLAIDGHIEGSADPKSVNYDLAGTYSKYNVKSVLHAKHSTNAPRDYDVEFEAKVLDSSVKFASHRVVVSDHENKFETSLELTPGGRYELNADVTCQREAGAANQRLVLVAKVPGNADPYKLDTGLEVNAQVFNAHVKASVGSKDLVDVFAKLTKGSSPTGSFKVLITNQVDGSGTFKFANGVGSLAGTIDLKKLNRKIKVSGDLAVTGTARVGSLDLFLDFDKDPNKKIHLATNTDFKKGSLDSKNTVIIFEYKTELNVKGTLEGKLTDGHVIASGDLTLPNGRVFTANVDRVLHVRDVDSEVNAKVELTSAEKAGSPVRAVKIALKGDKLNVRKGIFDWDVAVTYKTPSGKDVNYHVLAKSLPNDKGHHCEFKGTVKGSLLELAPLLHIKADVAKPLLTYYVKLHLAADSNAELTGKFQSSADHSVPVITENDLQLNLPTGELKNVRIAESWTLVRGQSDKPCKLSGWSSVTYNTDRSIKVELDLSGTKQAGEGTATVHLFKDEPRVIKGSFKVDKSQGVSREAELTVTKGDKQTHAVVKVVIPESRDSVHVDFAATTPLEKLKTVKIVFDGARLATTVETTLTVTTNDKTFVLTTKRGTDLKRPLIEIGLTYPNGKSFIGFHFVRKELGDNEFEGALDLEHGGNSLSAKLDARVPSPHDFDIVVHLDSAKLKLNKVVIKLSNKAAKGGKTLSVSKTEDGKEVVSGKLDYKFEDGSNGKLYEATGNLKVHGESQAAKISVTRNIISLPDETGTEIKILTSLGDKLTEAVYKRTNKHVHVLSKYCKTKAECGHFEYDSHLKISGTRGSLDAELLSTITAELDTTPVGGSAKCSFKAKTERKGRSLLHVTELKTKAGELYKTKLSINEKESELVLASPTRELAAEAKYSINVDAEKKTASWRYEATGWLDRVREPTLKSSLLVDGEIVRSDSGATVTSEARFSHPALGKELLVKSKTVLGGRQIVDSVTEFDVFAKKGQKIVLDAKILRNEINNGWNITSVIDLKSKGQNVDISIEGHAAASLNVLGIGASVVYKDDKQVKKDLGAGIQITTSNLVIFLKSPRELLLSLDAAYKVEDKLPSLKTTLEVVGCQAVVAEAHVEKDLKLVYAIYKKATPDRKVIGVTHIEPANKALASADWQVGKEKRELWNLAVAWGKGGKPEVSYNLDNIKALLEQMRSDVEFGVDKLKLAGSALATDTSTEINELLDGIKKAQPNLKPMLAAYQEQIKAIRAEIQDDKTVKEVSDLVKKLLGVAGESLAHVSDAIAKIADKALHVFEELSNAVLASLKRIVPAITNSLNKVFQVGVDIANALASQVLVCLQRLVEVVKKHEAEFKQAATVISEVTKDIARTVGKAVTTVWHEVRDFLAVIGDQLKALPAYSMIQERIQELKEQLKEYHVPEQVLETLKEVKGGLVDSLPTAPLQEFVTALFDYIEAVLRKKPVDDVEAVRAILRKLVAAAKSLIEIVRKEIGAEKPEDVAGAASWPLSLRTWARLPLLAAIHLSPIDLFRSDDLPSIKQLYYTYRPTLNPLDFIPPYKSYGILIDTSHFFTLDGRHFTLPACGSVILAQDAVNGNFSVVLNLEGGKFKSLQLSDEHDSLEVIKGGNLLHNGKAHEFPLHSGSLTAWRRYHSVNIKSSAGVWIKVDSDHHLAVVHVSGFYHGQVRGLLGDLNNEPFDDFRLPNGKVVTDVSEFGAAYTIGAKCGAAAHAHGHHEHHEQECTALFAANSPLRAAFPVVEPSAYREACDHLLSESAEGKRDAACRVAAAYVEAAREDHVKVDVPAYCGSCSAVGGAAIPVGDTVSVKSGAAADVILIVEQSKGNEEIYKELVTPLVAQLSKDLKDKGISDVDVSLLGYGGANQKWPAHYTSNGKLEFDGKAALEFTELPNRPTENLTRKEKWDALLHKLAVEVGRLKIRDALVEASTYPFRAGATRAVVLVTASPCEKSAVPFGLQKLRMLYVQKELRDRGIALHVVSSLAGLNVAGAKDAKTLKSIVGFDNHAVYSLSDAKKKPLEGNEDLRKDIEFNPDICVDNAVNAGGAAYSAGNFLEAKASQRKSFVSVVSRRVAESLSAATVADCTCSLEGGVHPQSHCKVTVRSAPEKLVKG